MFNFPLLFLDFFFFFFFNDTATTEIYTLSLHDALPIPVHPAVMSPLLVAALRTVTDFAPDILAAWRDARSLLDRIPPAPRPGGRADIRAYLQRLRDTGQPLPVFTRRQTGALARAHRVTQPGKTGPGRPLAHNRFIAGTLGVTAVQVTALLAAEPDVDR